LAGFQGGAAVVMGPRGGYLVGFLIASVMVVATRHILPRSRIFLASRILFAHAIILGCGVSYFSFFVGFEKAIVAGFYPFIVVDFVIKPVVVFCVVKLIEKTRTKARER
jgi:biotin transport system substrate-specific component